MLSTACVPEPRPVSPTRREHGSAVVDFVLVTMVLVPLVLGIIHLALVLHVRNTLTNTASEAARQAAVHGAGPGVGTSYARERVRDAIGGGFAREVSTRQTSIGGAPAVEVRIRAEVPPLGLWGPAVEFEVAGRAVQEQP